MREKGKGEEGERRGGGGWGGGREVREKKILL